MRTLLLPALLASLVVLEPSVASAQDAAAIAEARERFDRGIQLFDAGDYEPALVEFLRAHEIAPNYVVLLNIAHAYHRLGRPAQAVDAFERYLAEGGERVHATRRAEVLRELDALRPRVGEIVVNVTRPALAVVYLDDIEVGHTPLDAPLRVGAGQHVVEVRAEGFLSFRREVAVAGRASVAVDVALSPVAEVEPVVPVVGPTTDPETPVASGDDVISAEVEAVLRRRRSMRTASYVMAGLAAVTLVTTLALALWNRSEYSQWEEQDYEFEERFRQAEDPLEQGLEDDWNEHQHWLTEIQAMDTINWVLLGVGVAAAVTWAGLFFGAPDAPERATRVSFAPHREGAFLSLSWSFR